MPNRKSNQVARPGKEWRGKRQKTIRARARRKTNGPTRSGRAKKEKGMRDFIWAGKKRVRIIKQTKQKRHQRLPFNYSQVWVGLWDPLSSAWQSLQPSLVEFSWQRGDKQSARWRGGGGFQSSQRRTDRGLGTTLILGVLHHSAAETGDPFILFI